MKQKETVRSYTRSGSWNGSLEDGVDDGADDEPGLDPVLHVSVSGLGTRVRRPEAVVKGDRRPSSITCWSNVL